MTVGKGTGWLGTEGNFSLYILSCFVHCMQMNHFLFKKGGSERKSNLRQASALDTQLVGSTSFAGWSKFCEVGMFGGRSFAKIFSEKVSNIDFERTRDIIIQMALPFR